MIWTKTKIYVTNKLIRCPRLSPHELVTLSDKHYSPQRPVGVGVGCLS